MIICCYMKITDDEDDYAMLMPINISHWWADYFRQPFHWLIIFSPGLRCNISDYFDWWLMSSRRPYVYWLMVECKHQMYDWLISLFSMCDFFDETFRWCRYAEVNIFLDVNIDVNTMADFPSIIILRFRRPPMPPPRLISPPEDVKASFHVCFDDDFSMWLMGPDDDDYADDADWFSADKDWLILNIFEGDATFSADADDISAPMMPKYFDVTFLRGASSRRD